MKFDYNGVPSLDTDGFLLKLKDGSDFWRLHLDYCKVGSYNELGVYSRRQTPAEIIRNGNDIKIIYDSLTAEDGSVHDIRLELDILNINGNLEFSAKMENKSETRINELQYPFFEMETINGDFENDVLYIPEGLGRKIVNPHDFTAAAHTEYMAADYEDVWNIFNYPGDISMPWMGVQSGNMYLYMGWHSDVWRQFALVTGVEPRGENDKYFTLTISSYPAVVPGETVTYAGFVLAAFDGDWRDGADFYREWTDRTWRTSVKMQDFGNIHGWQRIILKHQFGEIYHTYDELPRIYREGAKYGLDMILLFAWWKEGMDSSYPDYNPDPELGGAEMLTQAIREINDMGGTVVLYANGHLIDVNSDFYKNGGMSCTVKDIQMNEYRECYRFSNNGTLLRRRHKTFAGGCHGTKLWRDKMVEIEKRHLLLGSNGTFFDQIGTCFELCFDKSHEHGNRIDEDPEYRLRTVKKMRECLGEGEFFGTEHAIDRLTHYMDFTHGAGFAQYFAEDAYPLLYRYTFPHSAISNRRVHDERDDYKRELNYAFVYGLIFDVSIYRGRADSIEDTPEYAEYIKMLVDMRKKYSDFFTKGKIDIPEVNLPENVQGAEYTYNDRKIIALWNDSEKDVSVSGEILPAQSVKVITLL